MNKYGNRRTTCLKKKWRIREYNNRTEDENQVLKELLSKERKLRKLQQK